MRSIAHIFKVSIVVVLAAACQATQGRDGHVRLALDELIAQSQRWDGQKVEIVGLLVREPGSFVCIGDPGAEQAVMLPENCIVLVRDPRSKPDIAAGLAGHRVLVAGTYHHNRCPTKDYVCFGGWTSPRRNLIATHIDRVRD